MQSAVRTHSDSGFSESELRLRQTSLLLQTHLMRLPPPLSAAGDLSLSAGFSAGTSSASPLSLSVEEIMLRHFTLHTI